MELEFFMAVKGKGETLEDVVAVFVARNELKKRAAIKRYLEAGLAVVQIDKQTFMALRLLAELMGAVEARGNTVAELEENIKKAKEMGLFK